MAKGKGNQKRKASNPEMDDWIASLAKQSAASSTTTNSNLPTLSKEERKQKRALKKAKKEQELAEKRKHLIGKASREEKTLNDVSSRKQQQAIDSTKRRLKRLSTVLRGLCDEHNKHDKSARNSTAAFAIQKARPVKRSKRPLNEFTIQPRPSDYSGIGLARSSLFLSFQDPSHLPKLEEEFHEHIPGFFGKQRTKAMKRQLDGNMLWRKLAKQKEKGEGIPKKFAHLSPDERVNAMIDAGLI